MNSGLYEVKYLEDERIGLKIIKCILKIIDINSSNITYQDTIYPVQFNTNPSFAKIGVTNFNGVFATSKRKLFPNLYHFPYLVKTNENSPEEKGLFSISKKVIIALTNETTFPSITKYYENEIIDGENIFSLNWEDGSTIYPNWRDYDLSTMNSTIIPNKFNNNVDSFMNYKFNKVCRIDSVKYLSIGANIIEDNYIILSWNTSLEFNNYGFEIEKKSENGDWKKIGFVQGNGMSSSEQLYSFVDKNYEFGILQYRIIQIDINGLKTYSDIINLDVAPFNKLFQNYPNPYH